MPTVSIRAAALILLALTSPSLLAQQGDGTDVSISTTIFKPAKVQATPERIAAIKAPPGFTVTPFAGGLQNARVLAVAPDGTVYLSRRDQGDVLMLKDADGDGRADGPPVLVATRAGAHGIAIHDGKFYLVTVKELFVADIKPDGTLGELKLLIGDLPDSGQHGNRMVEAGPDGMLYISAGSTCNDCNESNPENATILRVSPDGKSRTIFASGLRNTISYDWQPVTGELWGMDNGIDFLGEDEQPEELNHIEFGKNYGWPHVYADNKLYPQSTPVGGITKAEWQSTSVPMVMGYKAHSAPMQMTFYRGGNFPAEYVGDAFVTMRGSWNRREASGYEIVRVHFENGQATSIKSFVTGFLTDDGRTHIARPMGLAVARDGSLLMADDANGMIYRVAYTGDHPNPSPQARLTPPAASMLAQTGKGQGVALALNRPETATRAHLAVHSSAVTDTGPMAAKYSHYADDVSPDLQWTAMPGAASYLIVMEDPDSRPVTPTVHWLAWNIPAPVIALPEGLQRQPRLSFPDGIMQGRSTPGVIGYYGPHPPVGDSAHHYHVQVFALDSMLGVPDGSDRDTVLAAARGHVIASGEIVGLYAQTVKPPK